MITNPTSNERRLAWILMLLVLAFFMLPFLWMILGSLKARGEFFIQPTVWWPEELIWSNFPKALEQGALDGLIDSLIIATSSMVISVGLGTPAAYAIARFQLGRQHLPFWILSIRMFPPIATILPLFVIYRYLGLVDTHIGLIIAYTVFNLPFAIWILMSFMQELPLEIEEAAKVDGATPFQVFRLIVVPLVAPGLIVSALFTFIFAWNDFAYAIIFSGSNVEPLPVVIAQFAGGHEILWGPISASAIIAVLPVVIMAFFLQRYLARGLTMGAVK